MARAFAAPSRLSLLLSLSLSVANSSGFVACASLRGVKSDHVQTRQYSISAARAEDDDDVRRRRREGEVIKGNGSER